MISKYRFAIENTRLANQRTYMAYMRTSFIISAIAGMFKKKWIVGFGVVTIVMSTIQYLMLEYDLHYGEDLTDLSIFAVIYVILAFGVLYLQFIKKN